MFVSASCVLVSVHVGVCVYIRSPTFRGATAKLTLLADEVSADYRVHEGVVWRQVQDCRYHFLQHFLGVEVVLLRGRHLPV